MARLVEVRDLDMGLDPVTQFDQVYQAEYQHVVNYLYHLVSYEAEDLAQETFLRAYKVREQFMPIAPVESWLIRIAHNLAISFLRKKARTEVALDEALDHGYDAGYSRVDDRDMLRIMGIRLTRVQREMLMLKYGEHMTRSEIAKQTGIPVGTVNNRLYHARRRMHKVAV